MDKGDTPFNIFLDLSQAFDMLNHDILINKLKHCGINSTHLAWSKSYPTNRMQYVEIEGASSKLLHIKKGCTPSLNFSTLLFIIFINDIYNSGNEFEFITYADDTTLFCSLFALVIQIKICAESGDMPPRPRLVCQESASAHVYLTNPAEA